MKTALSVALLLFGLVSSASAQSLDELPPDVATVASDTANECIRWGGKPDYDPFAFVRPVFFNADWNGGGRESYVIDASALRCIGADIAQKDGRIGCQDNRCRLIVMTPRGKSGFRVKFNDQVESWQLLGANAEAGGPNVKIRTVSNGEENIYAVSSKGEFVDAN